MGGGRPRGVWRRGPALAFTLGAHAALLARDVLRPALVRQLALLVVARARARREAAPARDEEEAADEADEEHCSGDESVLVCVLEGGGDAPRPTAIPMAVLRVMRPLGALCSAPAGPCGGMPVGDARAVLDASMRYLVL